MFFVDRGVSVRREYAEHITALDTLLTRYKPDVLVVEDISAPTFRRGKRARSIITALADRALSYGIAVTEITRPDVYAHFGIPDAAPKIAIAQKVAERFPELAPYVPAGRRAWEREAYWMPVFEAVGMIVAVLKSD